MVPPSKKNLDGYFATEDSLKWKMNEKFTKKIKLIDCS